MKKFFTRAGLFIFLPLLVAELSLRLLTIFGPMTGTDRLYNVYDHLAPRLTSPDTVNCLFVGTSRIQAAIAPHRFTRAVDSSRATPITTLRASRGYSTLLMHYEGVKHLIDQRPEAMRGSLVFVEAPAGLAEPQTWTSRWARPEWPTLLSSHLSLPDLALFWWKGEDTLSTKTMITASQFLETTRYGTVMRSKIRQLSGSLLSALPSWEEHSEEKRNDASGEASRQRTETDIQKGAGIRTDSAGIALARQKIIPSMEKWAHVDYKRSPVNWEESILASMVETVRQHGGEVILYTMPLSSPAQSVIEESSVLQQERRRLQRWANHRSVPFLHVDFPHSDADFPDLAHLRRSKASTYTQQLAWTFVNQGRGDLFPRLGSPSVTLPHRSSLDLQ